MIDADNQIRIDKPTRYATEPEPVLNALYEKHLFHRKLTELGSNGPFADQIMSALEDWFTLDQLDETLRSALRLNRRGSENWSRSRKG